MFDKLFEPIQIGPIGVRNRIQILPHNTLFDIARLADYCSARSKGGAGLIEASLSTPIRELGELPLGPIDAWPYKGYDSRIIPHYRKLAGKIHEHGGKIFLQLAVAGGNRSSTRGVSSIPGGIQRVTARELTEGEISRIVEAHATACRYILEAGIDGVDLHGTHGMLLEEFYSRATNRRNDRYGGSLENRVRIIQEIITRIREETMGELAIAIRIDLDDKFPDGNDLSEEIRVAQSLDGLVDLLNMDIGFEHQYTHLSIAPMYEEPGFQIDSAKQVKRAVKKSLVGVAGRIVDPFLADHVIASSSADMVGMTRALIADPELPNKAREGRLDEIRLCLGDNQKCIGNMLRGLPIQCTINPLVGREGDSSTEITKTSTEKSILIIGAGLAGMEVARVSSLRGHRVSIYERNPDVGGQINLAAKLPKRSDFLSIVRWYEFQMKKLRINIKLNQDVSTDPEVIDYLLSEEKPDVVVLATGSRPIRDGVQSFDYRKIKGYEFSLTADDVLSEKVKPGKNILVLDELSFIEGLSLAQKFGEQNSSVELVTRDIAPGMELQWSLQIPYLYRLALNAGVKFTPNSFIEEIREKEVILYNIYTKERSVRTQLDSVILLTGRVPNDDLFKAFSGKVEQLLTVGDCNLAGRQVGDNLQEAFDVALTI